MVTVIITLHNNSGRKAGLDLQVVTTYEFRKRKGRKAKKMGQGNICGRDNDVAMALKCVRCLSL